MPLVEFLIACCAYAPFLIYVSSITIGTVFITIFGFDYFMTPAKVDPVHPENVPWGYVAEIVMIWSLVMIFFMMSTIFSSVMQSFLFNPVVRRKLLYHSDDLGFCTLSLFCFLLSFMTLPGDLDTQLFTKDFRQRLYIVWQLVSLAYCVEWLRAYGITFVQIGEVLRDQCIDLCVSFVFLHFGLFEAMTSFVIVTDVGSVILKLIQMLSFLVLPLNITNHLWTVSTGVRVWSLVEVASLGWCVWNLSWTPFFTWRAIAILIVGLTCCCRTGYDVITGTKFILRGLVAGIHPLGI